MKENISNVVRFGVSMESETLNILDRYVIQNNYSSRSQAIRSLVTKIELNKKWDSNQLVGGSITLSYDHHKRELLDKITKVQHDYYYLILCSQHIHLDHNTCMEIIALKGKATELNQLANELISIKGIVHGALSITVI